MPVPFVSFDRRIGSDLIYTVDLSNQKFVESQNLASVTVSVVSGTLTVTPSVSGKVVYLRVSGGAAGTARLDVRAVAADGQTFAQPVDFATSSG